jgi:transposase
MAKKYIVELTADERDRLKDFVRRGKQSARRITRARILLLADEGRTDEQIWTALQIGRSTVERTRQRFVEEGVEAALSERPRPG